MPEHRSFGSLTIHGMLRSEHQSMARSIRRPAAYLTWTTREPCSSTGISQKTSADFPRLLQVLITAELEVFCSKGSLQ